jgi:hypothetical protein
MLPFTIYGFDTEPTGIPEELLQASVAFGTYDSKRYWLGSSPGRAAARLIANYYARIVVEVPMLRPSPEQRRLLYFTWPEEGSAGQHTLRAGAREFVYQSRPTPAFLEACDKIGELFD